MITAAGRKKLGALIAQRNRTHGMTESPEYRTWHAMRNRCFRLLDRKYALYGGRGITVCEQWRDSFAAFLADMGQRPTEAHSLDRYPNNNGNYEPGNVRWATRDEQGRNKRNNRVLEWRGESKCIAAWAEQLGIPHGLIRNRLSRGWTTERALTNRGAV